MAGSSRDTIIANVAQRREAGIRPNDGDSDEEPKTHKPKKKMYYKKRPDRNDRVWGDKEDERASGAQERAELEALHAVWEAECEAEEAHHKQVAVAGSTALGKIDSKSGLVVKNPPKYKLEPKKVPPPPKRAQPQALPTPKQRSDQIVPSKEGRDEEQRQQQQRRQQQQQ